MSRAIRRRQEKLNKSTVVIRPTFNMKIEAVKVMMLSKAKYIIENELTYGTDTITFVLADFINDFFAVRRKGIDRLNQAESKMLKDFLINEMDSKLKMIDINPPIMMFICMEYLLREIEEEHIIKEFGKHSDAINKTMDLLDENESYKTVVSEHRKIFNNIIKEETVLSLKERKIISKTIKEIKPIVEDFYINNDKGHQFDHVESVMNLALEINAKFNLKIKVNLIVISAYVHDMYSSLDRVNHHTKAKEFVIKSIKPIFMRLSNDERLAVAHAVGEHRGSYTGEFYSILSEVISLADRGVPNIDNLLVRCFNSAMDRESNFKEIDNDVLKHLSCFEQAVVKSYKHLKNKYTSNGYARYTDLYKNYFKSDLEVFQAFFDNLTDEILRQNLRRLRQQKRIKY